MIKAKIMVIFLSILMLSSPIIIVHADVPTVISITRKMEGSNLVIDVKVRHNGPSQVHFIDKINLDLDGVVKTYTDLPKVTTDESTFTVNLGNVSPKTLKAQVNCNMHGLSAYLTESSTPSSSPSSGISGYPLESVLIGVIVAFMIVVFSSKYF